MVAQGQDVLLDDEACMGSAAVLATVSSSNQVGRKDLTPMAVLELRHLISSRRRLWYIGGTIQAGINTFM